MRLKKGTLKYLVIVLVGVIYIFIMRRMAKYYVSNEKRAPSSDPYKDSMQPDQQNKQEFEKSLEVHPSVVSQSGHLRKEQDAKAVVLILYICRSHIEHGKMVSASTRQERGELQRSCILLSLVRV